MMWQSDHLIIRMMEDREGYFVGRRRVRDNGSRRLVLRSEIIGGKAVRSAVISGDFRLEGNNAKSS